MTTIEPSPRTPLPDRSSSRRQFLHSSDCWIARASANSRCSMRTGTSQTKLIVLRRSSKIRVSHSTRLVSSSILKLAQLENRGADLLGKFPLFASIPLDSPHHVAALIIEGLEQAGKYQFCLFLPFGFAARDDICNRLLRVIEGRAARRKPGDQIPDRGIFLPSVSDVVDRRPCPYGSDGNLRHLDLIARPIGKAGIGGERRALQGESNGGGHSERPTSHVPPPGSPRRARNPRAGSYARIAPTMNRAVHPPTTASEIQLIWQ